MNLSVVPNVSATKLAQCSDPRAGLQMIMLDGAHSACAWDVDPRSAQPGIFPADQLPQLQRTDYRAASSNDSAWMVNPKAPLPVSPPVDQPGQHRPRARAARFALQRLHPWITNRSALPTCKTWSWTTRCTWPARSCRICCAFCAEHLGTDAAALSRCAPASKTGTACQPRQRPGSGALHQPGEHLEQIPDAWRVAFDPAQPLTTPRGLAIDRAPVRQGPARSHAGLAVRGRQLGLTATAANGATYKSPAKPRSTAARNSWHLQRHANRTHDGKREVVSGSSYLQMVHLNTNGPEPKAY